jgi:hypothetical protein
LVEGKFLVEFDFTTPRICQYRYDIIVYLKDALTQEVAERFGIELSGTSYYFNSGKLMGNKQLKYEILKSHGWKTCIVQFEGKLGKLLEGQGSAGGKDYDHEAIAKEVVGSLKKQLGEQGFYGFVE